jgi:hypothetical protein
VFLPAPSSNVVNLAEQRMLGITALVAHIYSPINGAAWSPIAPI